MELADRQDCATIYHSNSGKKKLKLLSSLSCSPWSHMHKRVRFYHARVTGGESQLNMSDRDAFLVAKREGTLHSYCNRGRRGGRRINGANSP